MKILTYRTYHNKTGLKISKNMASAGAILMQKKLMSSKLPMIKNPIKIMQKLTFDFPN